MTAPGLLTLTDLVGGLERQKGRYQALDVFATSVKELRDAVDHGHLGELQRLDPKRPWFGFVRDGRSYQIKVHGGIARLTRQPGGPLGLTDDQLALGLLGAALGSTKQLPGMLLGFLVGTQIAPSPNAPRDVLTVRYDETEARWRAYDGPLGRWIREEALRAEPAMG
ncbi:MAG: hypothetical protein KBG48_08500 [Kofleriaceae bacterium]|jgi:hypothetical protein|nr:hypothetical protein [Kofleriaceae bacterium]MBP9167412.1 hypothetical protein [Kofleriaceae bacterium]MBP9860708.1 hypothetical protein [Kofleriaceae bacterium]